MKSESKDEGRIEYVDEGFVINWDKSGLEIRVTDYHAKPLRLSWKDILSLAKIAGGIEQAGNNR